MSAATLLSVATSLYTWANTRWPASAAAVKAALPTASAEGQTAGQSVDKENQGCIASNVQSSSAAAAKPAAAPDPPAAASSGRALCDVHVVMLLKTCVARLTPVTPPSTAATAPASAPAAASQALPPKLPPSQLPALLKLLPLVPECLCPVITHVVDAGWLQASFLEVVTLLEKCGWPSDAEAALLARVRQAVTGKPGPHTLTRVLQWVTGLQQEAAATPGTSAGTLGSVAAQVAMRARSYQGAGHCRCS